MICSSCNAVLSTEVEQLPGDPTSETWCCPCCLRRVQLKAGGDGDVSVERFSLRRQARRSYIEGLWDGKDSSSCCPRCDHAISPRELLILESSEHFNCPGCTHDLAQDAYRQVAFEEAAWLAVAAELDKTRALEPCSNCAAMIAAARICQHALLVVQHEEQSQKLEELTRRPEKEIDPDCQVTCELVNRYRDLVSNRLQIL